MTSGTKRGVKAGVPPNQKKLLADLAGELILAQSVSRAHCAEALEKTRKLAALVKKVAEDKAAAAAALLSGPTPLSPSIPTAAAVFVGRLRGRSGDRAAAPEPQQVDSMLEDDLDETAAPPPLAKPARKAATKPTTTKPPTPAKMGKGKGSRNKISADKEARNKASGCPPKSRFIPITAAQLAEVLQAVIQIGDKDGWTKDQVFLTACKIAAFRPQAKTYNIYSVVGRLNYRASHAQVVDHRIKWANDPATAEWAGFDVDPEHRDEVVVYNPCDDAGLDEIPTKKLWKVLVQPYTHTDYNWYLSNQPV